MLEQYITNPYLRALAILAIVFVATRILVFIIQKIFVTATKKTKTNIDDLIIEKSSKPITLIAFLIGLRVALIELPLAENLMNIFSNIIITFIIIAVSYLAYAVVNIIIFNSWKKLASKTQSDLDDSLIGLVHSVLKAIWVIFTLLYALNLWGIEIGPFLAGLGIGGLAVAFALQSSLSNIFGGVSIILDKTVKVGDLVYLDDGTQGKIQHIGLRSTKITTFDNELIIVPNGKLADSKVQNVTLPDPKSRVVIPFGVAYGSDIEKVKKIALSEVKKVKNFCNNPGPFARFLEMAESSLNFKVFFYVDSFEHRGLAKDEANTRIYNALNKAKIEIPFPQMDVHVRK
ncbi:mechanosensitive ion channel family protein [Nanoarchaeota archaeon]